MEPHWILLAPASTPSSTGSRLFIKRLCITTMPFLIALFADLSFSSLLYAEVTPKTNATDNPTATPPPQGTSQKPQKLGKKKRASPKSKKSPLNAHQWKEPPSPAPKPEQTRIEPYLTYRISALKPRKESIYHKKDHVDQADQIYMTLKFVRVYDYRHEIAIEPSLRTFRNNPANWEPPIVEQAYIESAISKSLSFTVGKKLEYEGSGFMVNPSDLLNENKDVFDSLYQKEGVIFSRIRHQSPMGTFSLGYIPKRSQAFSGGKAWLAANTEAFEIDIRSQVTIQESDKATVGFSAARFFGDHLELHVDSRYQHRQRRIAELDFMEYSSYVGPNIESQSDDIPSVFYVVGSRYVFPPRRTLVLEYISNESGLLPNDFRRRNEALRAETVEKGRVSEPPTRLLGRHFGFFSFQDDDTLSQTHLAATVLVNTDDLSVYGTLGAKYTLSPITSVEWSPNFFIGRKDSEFGEMPFFNAFYLIFRGKF